MWIRTYMCIIHLYISHILASGCFWYFMSMNSSPILCRKQHYKMGFLDIQYSYLGSPKEIVESWRPYFEYIYTLEGFYYIILLLSAYLQRIKKGFSFLAHIDIFLDKKHLMFWFIFLKFLNHKKDGGGGWNPSPPMKFFSSKNFVYTHLQHFCDTQYKNNFDFDIFEKGQSLRPFFKPNTLEIRKFF